MFTPFEIAWFAVLSAGGQTETITAEAEKALGASGYSLPERTAAALAVDSYRPDADPLEDPALCALASIWALSPHTEVQDAAHHALHAMLDNAAGGPQPAAVRASLLAALVISAEAPRLEPSAARRLFGDLIDESRQAPSFDPVAIAWAAARAYARDEWNSDAEPDHTLMRQTADAALLDAAEVYEPLHVFTDPVLRALVHMAQQFDTSDESGAADIALGTARMMIARVTPAAYGRFAIDLQANLVWHRYAGELGAATAVAIYENTLRIHSA